MKKLLIVSMFIMLGATLFSSDRGGVLLNKKVDSRTIQLEVINSDRRGI